MHDAHLRVDPGGSMHAGTLSFDPRSSTSQLASISNLVHAVWEPLIMPVRYRRGAGQRTRGLNRGKSGRLCGREPLYGP